MTTKSLNDQVAEITTVLPRVMRRLFVLHADDLALELPMAQMRVCSLLYDGSQTMSALSRELGISLSAITQIADRLGRSKMVERISEVEDRRVKTLRLTDQGREMMRLRRERRKRRVTEVLGSLDPDSRQAVLFALHTLLDAAHKTAPDAAGSVPEEKGLL